jgi:hypothetical protein
VLVPTQVDFRGDIVDAIRVRGVTSPRPTPSSEPAPIAESPFDDDLSDFVA